MLDTNSAHTVSSHVLQASAAHVFPWSQWAQVAPRWQALVANSSIPSFFLTTDWVATWIETFGPQLGPEIVFFSDPTGDLAACILVHRSERRGPVFIRRLYLNTAGEDESDETFLERNTLLCAAGREQDAAAALGRYLLGQSWDELILNGCLRSTTIAAITSAFAGTKQVCSTRSNFYVDLGALRTSGKAYDCALSAKTRYNIRQSLKLYEQIGPLRTRFASDERDAQVLLTKLAELHQSRWEAKSMPGAFASAKFMHLHRTLIARLFSKNAVELVEVTAGDTPIGFLYNFVLGSTVSFYQCGFNYSENKRLRPGLVSLFLVIGEYIKRGLDEFDLMEGDTEYKRSLSSAARELDWIVIERPTWKHRLLNGLTLLKDRYEAKKEEVFGGVE
jgi:CelD/BcsL family acetyltransferase involved in cellulose biosynthesis